MCIVLRGQRNADNGNERQQPYGNELILRPAKTNTGGEFAEQILEDLIAQGYSGRNLLERFDRIREDYTVGEAKTGDLSGVYCYDIYYNRTNYGLVYTVEYQEDRIIVIIMAGTRENFYDELKQYMREA